MYVREQNVPDCIGHAARKHCTSAVRLLDLTMEPHITIMGDDDHLHRTIEMAGCGKNGERRGKC